MLWATKKGLEMLSFHDKMNDLAVHEKEESLSGIRRLGEKTKIIPLNYTN